MNNNLNFCGIFSDLTIDAINSGSGSEAPILLAEEEKEFKADEILENLKDLQKNFEKLWEIEERYFDHMEKYYDRIEKEKADEEYKRFLNK
jgi:hypothetical protein